MEKDVFCPKCKILIEDYNISVKALDECDVEALVCPHCNSVLYYESSKVEELLNQQKEQLEDLESEKESLTDEIESLKRNLGGMEPSDSDIDAYINSKIESNF